ncbi:GyrI-like domain-containing protein [Dehalogenimonas sp. THU2]|uniref:GyrI-like domain-containing protein n=1 Tax=Dehalogenimonas sp. THU2 TaxID=3151121 RepID=UPI0032182E6A
MDKLDLKKELKHLFNPPQKEPVIVDVPPMNYLMIDGRGQPDGPEAVAAIETLYPVAYTLKFTVKKEQGIDYGVMPLEGLWWSDDMTDFLEGRRDRWQWTYMIMHPEFITAAMVEKAIDEVRRKKNPAAIGKVKFESLAEGKAAQIMHIGPYSEEGPNILKLHAFIHDAGLSFDGQIQKHHEIYLSDPRRTAPDKWKTIIRQPVK